MRHYSFTDTILSNVLQCIRTASQKPASHVRASPAASLPEPELDLKDAHYSAALMRVNHAGEVCAQALYLGQGLTTRNPTLQQLFKEAAYEEADHLAWCQTRLTELNSHTSYLNPLWFTGSLLIGTCAGLLGNRFSLGFLAETENQVYRHLGSHLEKLPTQDTKSRAIVKTMQAEEVVHANNAMHHGGGELPLPIKEGMRFVAKIMTRLAAIL